MQLFSDTIMENMGIKYILLFIALVLWNAQESLTATNEWSVWSDWGPCSVTCDVGLKRRYRECQDVNNLCFGDSSEYDICKTKPCTETQVAFSATGVVAVSGNSGPVSFPNVLQNLGNAYSPSSGSFTCRVPGIYHIAFSVSKLYADVVFSMTCHIQINGINKVGSYRSTADLSDYGDGYGIGTSLTHHLAVNDTVNIGDCDNISKLDNSSFSTFNGFLVTPDQ